MSIFSFRKTRQPQAGVEAMAFLPGMLNPVYRLGGTGTYVNPPWVPTSPQSYYPYLRAPVAGLGGLIYDGSYFQPLLASRRR